MARIFPTLIGLSLAGTLAACGAGGEREQPDERSDPPQQRLPARKLPDRFRCCPDVGFAWPVKRYRAPGERIALELTARPPARSVRLDADARVRLVRTTRDRRQLRIIATRAWPAGTEIAPDRPLVFEAALPAETPAHYALVLDLREPGGRSERYASYFYVPEQDVEAVLRLETTTVRRGETRLPAVLENRGSVPLEFGAEYRLERRRLGRWRRVKLDLAFIQVVLGVAPGESYEFDVQLPPDLDPGRYRVAKPIGAPRPRLTVYAEFEVRD